MHRTHSFARLALILVVVALFASSMSVAAQEAITPGTPIEGEYTGEPQIYTISATRGQLLIINMASEDFDSLVHVQQGETELGRDDDSAGNLNALLAYVVQADGDYEIVADAPFFNADSGAFTLSVDVVDPMMLTLDTPTTIDPGAEGVDQVYGVFEAATGDVVNVLATNMSEDESIIMALKDTGSATIENDRDDGPGYNPLLRRIVLPADGLYLVVVENSSSDELVTQPVEITVESTEQLFLSPAPQPLVLGNAPGHTGTEVYTVETTAGTTYRFIVTIAPVPDEEAGIQLDLLDTDRFFEPTLETRHSVGVTWDYVANENATIRLDVHPNFFGRDIDEINYTIALEEVG